MSTESIEVKIKEKRFFIILGAIIGAVLLAIITMILINRADDDNPSMTKITLCDMDASGLCVVTFGTNNLDRMVINFQLPDEDYPLFYVKASNREIVNVYSCEVAEAASTSAYCTGVRTPLGELIDIEVYTTDGDVFIARGEFIVSAILLSTPLTTNDSIGSETTTPTLTPSPTRTVTPIETEAAQTSEEGLSTASPETASPTPIETEATQTSEEGLSTASPETASPNP